MNKALSDLSAQGVSVWLDDLSRERITSGSLAGLIDSHSVVGVTTNPSIFAAALSKGDTYADAIKACADAGTGVEETIFGITTDDVRSACDIFSGVFQRSGGQDGRVSIEVDPRLSADTAGTIAEAGQLWATVDRPNALIKIPATLPSLPAITAVLGQGISVNVTLIFSLERYREVMEAFLAGLELAQANGHDLSKLHSVASFFVSRVDTEIDKRLDALGTPAATALKGQAGVANARLAYQAYEETLSGPRWEALAAAGANRQRPLWASTGVKDPAYPDTMYVTDLVAPGTVNTMPEATLQAMADHGVVSGDTVRGTYSGAAGVMSALAEQGIEIDEVTTLLETEGVEKFEKSWSDLLGTVSDALAQAATSESV